MKVAGTDDVEYVPIHGECSIKLHAKKTDCIHELDAGAGHLYTSGGIGISQSGTLDAVPKTTPSLRWVQK